MRRAVLLGVPGTKRTVYLNHAAEQEGVPLAVLDWEGWREHLPEGELFLKIDPPRWDSSALGDLERLTEAYKKELDALNRLTGERQAEYLNSPSAIAWLLDKRRCKERLMEAGLPVTELLGQDPAGPDGYLSEAAAHKPSACGRIRNMEELLEEMSRHRTFQVFIKPVCGSGGAGVCAFRIQPGTGRMMLYTCAADAPDGLWNTKRLRACSGREQIRHILDQLLAMDCVVERWYARAMHGAYSCDFRGVVQGGRVDHLLARLSRGPITNLQLNNHPLPAEEAGLTSGQREMVEDLCERAAGCFPGLWSVGIDLLLEKGSLTPRIIEMNAQGDLIYQDIYGENIIYRRQAERMKRWLSA